MITYVCPGGPNAPYGGLRKLWDHVGILTEAGLDAQGVEVGPGQQTQADPDDLLVIPEIYAEGIRLVAPHARRAVFIQSVHLAGGEFLTAPRLEAVLTISERTAEQIRERFPSLSVPIFVLRPSITGRPYGEASFRFGEWPRRQVVAYFSRKCGAASEQVVRRLSRAGWEFRDLGGLSDEQIAEAMREAAIFVAFSHHEGCPAPPREALACGAVLVGWDGDGEADFFEFGYRVPDGDVDGLIGVTAGLMDCFEADPMWAAQASEAGSAGVLRLYSREQEKRQVVETFQRLLQPTMTESLDVFVG